MKQVTVFFTPKLGSFVPKQQYTQGPTFWADTRGDLTELADLAFEASNAPDEHLTAAERNIRLLWKNQRSMSVGDIVEIRDSDDILYATYLCLNIGWKAI